MKKHRILTLLLAILIFVSAFTPSVLAVPDTTAPTEEDGEFYFLAPNSELLPEPSTSSITKEHQVKAKAALLLELNSNTIVYEQNSSEKLYPASLTKIMTCMLALDYGSLDDIVTVSSSAVDNMDPDGSSADLVAGEKLSLRNLLYCMMLSSANEACNVVAEYIADRLTSASVTDVPASMSKIDLFVALMNEKAAALGCKNTHFANPHGLHDENHYTTAYDLSLITRKALENQTFREIVSVASYNIPATNKSEERRLTTTNHLLDTSSVYYYSKASGIKTGFTTPAGRCLISTATNGDLKFLSVVMGASETVLESGDVWYYHFSETKDLFDYGFDSYSYAMVLADTNNIDQVKVADADGRDTVVLKPTTGISALLPKDYDTKLITTRYTLFSENGLQAPLEKGQQVGTVFVYYDGVLIGQTTIETLTEVKHSSLSKTFREAGNVVKSYWWILPVLLGVILLLLLVLILRAAALRRKRRAALRRRRANAARRNGGNYSSQTRGDRR